MIGLIIKSTGKYSLVKVDEKIYKCLLRGNFRLDNNLSNPVVSGDKVEIELDFDKRPNKKDVLHRLFDVMKENKVSYKLYKYNNRLYDFVQRRT